MVGSTFALKNQYTMRIILCLDFSPFTEQVLSSMKTVVGSFKECDISVLHVIDETLFAGGAGYDILLNDELKGDSARLRDLCVLYLGEKVHYIEEYGIPRKKIDEVLAESMYDLLAIGDHSRNTTGIRLLGGVAEHLLRNSRKPVLIIK